MQCLLQVCCNRLALAAYLPYAHDDNLAYLHIQSGPALNACMDVVMFCATLLLQSKMPLAECCIRFSVSALSLDPPQCACIAFAEWQQYQIDRANFVWDVKAMSRLHTNCMDHLHWWCRHPLGVLHAVLGPSYHPLDHYPGLFWFAGKEHGRYLQWPSHGWRRHIVPGVFRVRNHA